MSTIATLALDFVLVALGVVAGLLLGRSEPPHRTGRHRQTPAPRPVEALRDREQRP